MNLIDYHLIFDIIVNDSQLHIKFRNLN